MIQASMYSASVGQKKISKFTFATIGSIKDYDLFKHFKYVIIDECHGVNGKADESMLTSFFKAINCEHICGLTATPYRLDVLWEKEFVAGQMQLTSTATLKMLNRIAGKGKKPFFGEIAYQIETPELIKAGYLSPIKYLIEQTDWSQLRVNTTGADFRADSVLKWARNRVERVTAALEYADGAHKRSLTFCANLEQAAEIQEAVEALGIRTELVSGKTPKKEREKLITAYKAGDFRHMLNVGVFTTGFDMPNLDCVILAKPTMSLALYYQMVGRGVRLDPDDPGKVLHVYDMAGVVKRLGRVETIRVVKEPKGFRNEVHTEVGRLDGYPLYSFTVEPKKKEEENAN